MRVNALPRNAKNNRHLGVLTNSMSLLLGLATAHTGEYEALVPLAVHVLSLMVLKCP